MMSSFSSPLPIDGFRVLLVVSVSYPSFLVNLISWEWSCSDSSIFEKQ